MGTTTLATTQELLARERRFWEAMRSKDGAQAARMTDETCVVVGAQGVSTIDPKSMEKMTGEGTWELEEFTFDEGKAQVKLIGDGIAIIAYRVNEHLIVDGKPLTLEANDASVWVRHNGDWVCALHTETPAGDPFGRDKVATPKVPR